MLPVSNPGTAASLTDHESPLVLVTVVHPQAVDEEAATITVTATASRHRRRRQAAAGVERNEGKHVSRFVPADQRVD
jgi:hypothetical protein